ncbi:ER membrane protein complex subunit 2 [Aphelenchoides besseyi]|nr:ER membrane protein complex subunit 2 [Aphelenchoides besseyi]KAI6227864.1 ER membrane protein complex subunit 2 [Aphelenchoides besseyi]
MVETQDWTDISYDEARTTLRRWREEHIRRSEEVIEIWEHVLSRYSKSLNDELWLVLEQVLIAALDCSRHDLALKCIQTLSTQFPKSGRVAKLQAIRLEALGKYEEAHTIYDSLLAADDTNSALEKRKIAALIAQGQRTEAIRWLCEHLETFVNDSEAWSELAELYVQEADLPRAIHCFEELLLVNPHNGAVHCRLGELRYTQGGTENYEYARAYFERAVRLNVGARALYGLVLCCNALLAKSSAQKKKEIVDVGRSAVDSLAKIYAENPKANAVYGKVHKNFLKTLSQ